jgi:hypothetical protein
MREPGTSRLALHEFGKQDGTFGGTTGADGGEGCRGEGTDALLSAAFGALAARRSGLELSLELQNEEPIEVKGESH